MADDISADLAHARRLIAWLWLSIAVCAGVTIIDLMLKQQMGRIAVEVGRARG